MNYPQQHGGEKERATPPLRFILAASCGVFSLDFIKTDEDLKRIPVVVLTVLRAEEDIMRSYDHHANGYITKPIGFNQFMTVTRTIEEFWLTIVKLPPK